MLVAMALEVVHTWIMNLRRRLLTVVSAALGIALTSLALESAMLPGQMWFLQASMQPAPPEVAPLPDLVEQHDCWTGSPPADMAGKIPGHVVIRFTDGEPKLGGTRAVGIALEHIFQAPDPRVAEVYAFCR